MRPFVFRAEPVLEMRRRDDEAAQRALARAIEDLRQAEAAVEEARTKLEEAGRRAAQIDARAGELTLPVWYRNWMRAQQQELDARQAHRDRCLRDAGHCRQAAVEARRRLRVLERLKARRWLEYQRTVEREDQKALDQLGTLRHVIRQRGGHP